DDEVHAAVNDLEAGIGTYLYGRRMYEVMRFWASAPTGGEGVGSAYARIWQAADKIVYSRTLTGVGTPRTELRAGCDPAAVRALVAAADRDVSIGGPGLAGAALRAGLVDELHLYAHPVVIGSGTHWLPDLRLDLELLDQRWFACGVVHLH